MSNETVKNAVKSLSDMKDDTVTLAASIVAIMISLIALLAYMYVSGTFFSDGLNVRNCKNMDEMFGTLNGKIISIDTTNELYQYSLRDYYIKSAYNACSGGNYKNGYVNTCILKDLLKQGVRGLDFEVYSIDDQPVVASSTSENYCVKETFNSVPFSEVLNIIRDYAFANSTAPNQLDPIILHLRIKSSNTEMYDNFAKLLEGYDSMLMGKQYSFENQAKNFGAVKLSDMSGKVVIIVDRSNLAFLESEAFYEYVNMTSNSIFMRALHYYDIINAPDMIELINYNKLNMTIGMPDKGSDPDNPSSITMRTYGVQMLAMRYQVVDTNLEENDMFFNDAGRAFVLKPEKLRYVPETMPDPVVQDPTVSFATREVKTDFYQFEI
jgi:Phosphatidylinositol-specific phospholipase C, Y domain./Phosphatidylinositol-specific phospholipase C, X domain.